MEWIETVPLYTLPKKSPWILAWENPFGWNRQSLPIRVAQKKLFSEKLSSLGEFVFLLHIKRNTNSGGEVNFSQKRFFWAILLPMITKSYHTFTSPGLSVTWFICIDHHHRSSESRVRLWGQATCSTCSSTRSRANSSHSFIHYWTHANTWRPPL